MTTWVILSSILDMFYDFIRYIILDKMEKANCRLQVKIIRRSNE